MSLDADSIVERRRLRRKLTFWRVGAVAIALVAVVGAAFAWMRVNPLRDGGSYIARVEIKGLIRGDQDRVDALERLGKSSSAAAVVVHIDSPGGTTAGSEQLYDALTRLKAQKPLAVVIDGLGASGGYLSALASDHIVAQSASLVGSIGVLFQFPNFTDLLKTVGVHVEEIKSSPLKAAPNGLEPTSPEARAAIESLVMDSFAWFKGLVAERRNLSGEPLDSITDGRVFTGRQAVALKLIDELGDERTAVAWLAKEKGIDAKLPVRNFRLQSRFSDLPFLHAAMAKALDAAGLTGAAQVLLGWRAMENLNLDGMLALWHPSAVR
jgi:protease-4